MPNVTIVNIHAADSPLPDHINWVVTCGTKLPFDDLAFDIAFSNSVIEHLYTWEMQTQFANEISIIAPNFFVQTPSKSFFYPFTHSIYPLAAEKIPKTFDAKFYWVGNYYSS